MHRIRGKLTYSNVMVTVLAILVVGGGTAYAASEMLPKNSVGSKQIKKEAVTPAKLSTAAKATLTGAAGPKGATGATGPQGPQGVKGEAASAGKLLATATRVVGESSLSTTAGELRTAEVECPAGTVAISGGAGWVTENDKVSTIAGLIRVSRPIPPTEGAGAATGWQATGENTDAFTRKLEAYAICVAE